MLIDRRAIKISKRFSFECSSSLDEFLRWMMNELSRRWELRWKTIPLKNIVDQTEEPQAFYFRREVMTMSIEQRQLQFGRSRNEILFDFRDAVRHHENQNLKSIFSFARHTRETLEGWSWARKSESEFRAELGVNFKSKVQLDLKRNSRKKIFCYTFLLAFSFLTRLNTARSCCSRQFLL